MKRHLSNSTSSSETVINLTMVSSCFFCTVLLVLDVLLAYSPRLERDYFRFFCKSLLTHSSSFPNNTYIHTYMQ